MNPMYAALAIAATLLAAPGYDEAKAAVLADYASYSKADQAYIRYLDWTAAKLTDEQIDALHAFWLPHVSRQQIIERHMPLPIRAKGERCGMYRIDLRDLKWDLETWYQLAKEYPYAPGNPNPLIVRGDWLMWITGYGTESQLYYHALYGFNKGPKNRADFFKFWGVDEKASEGFDHATIIDEGNSGVSFATRLVVERRTPQGFGWETFDTLAGAGKNDPIGQIRNGLKNYQYDAGELITSIPKVQLSTGETWYAQAYLLTNGQAVKVEEANAQVVKDTTAINPVVINPISCMRCHTTGILSLPENLVRGLAKIGVETFAYSKDDAAEFERKFMAVLDRVVKRQQEDFCGWLPTYTELTLAEVIKLYADTVATFEGKVTLEQAAHELHVDVQTFVHDSALYGRSVGELPTRYAQLIHGRAVPRRVWQEDIYPLAYKIFYGAH